VVPISSTEKAEFLDAVMKLAREEKTTLPVRIAAVQALAAFKGPRATELLTRDVLPSRHTELAVEAARSLARLGTPEALEALQRTAGAPSASFSLRQTAVAGLAGTRPGTTWLLQAIADKRLGKDLTPDLARLLRNSPFPDLRNKALIVLPPPGKLDPKNLPSIPALLARRGNVNRGRDLMLATLKNEVQCLKCHTIEGTGGKVGPELTVIGSKASRENLLESILYPSRAIADQYVSWVVETRDGRAITGLLIEDAADHIVLRDANANDYKIHRKDIESRARIQTSLMPDNLLQYMPEADLVDMVEYLYSLKSPSISGR
jgi:putative heme-binding domain-containing protein